MCKDCANAKACKAIGIPESDTPRKEACFVPEALMSLFDLATLAGQAPVTRYATKGDETQRV